MSVTMMMMAMPVMLVPGTASFRVDWAQPAFEQAMHQLIRSQSGVEMIHQNAVGLKKLHGPPPDPSDDDCVNTLLSKPFRESSRHVLGSGQIDVVDDRLAFHLRLNEPELRGATKMFR